MIKKCIFHYPHPINENPGTGSEVRPYRMVKAFEQNGYIVDKVIGYGKDRKNAILKIKDNLKKGVRYDFLYSESLTQPTLLAEEDHFPRYPFLDFNFFNLCKKYHIPIGLFYRDMHWKFPEYKEAVSWYKRCITIPLYKWDLFNYKKLLKILYVPAEGFKDYLSKEILIKSLPPGCKENVDIVNAKKVRKDRKTKELHIFYVGGVKGIYNPYSFIKAVNHCKNVTLTICTTQEQWEMNKERYKDLLCERIKIIHKKSQELAPYYKEADVSILCQESNLYMDMSSPIKAKETLGYGTPIIISSNLSLSKVVQKENYGWVVDANVKDIEKLLVFLSEHFEEIKEKTLCAIDAINKNTWEARAEQVATELMEFGKEI